MNDFCEKCNEFMCLNFGTYYDLKTHNFSVRICNYCAIPVKQEELNKRDQKRVCKIFPPKLSVIRSYRDRLTEDERNKSIKKVKTLKLMEKLNIEYVSKRCPLYDELFIYLLNK